ncbi:serine hydrolase [Amycolatopsis sp. WAC 01375]|uniref:serine hydrolase domain-containing protein n=1 Tax=Amycolatopsis sp. WAC 01375 TaxID=2203194 RepID=UPI000F773A87|nr:serine hydrolase domain-containing protein [Amycolatopsis sp. WAC 01375]RSM81744.1 serine hydrolase [Amycolatopsis sp. WAC 01375]
MFRIAATAALLTITTVLTAPAAQAATPASAAAVFDEIIPRSLAEHHIPGAAVVVVEGGETVFSAGYGVSSVDTQAKVDPERTGFLINSVGKSIAATAAIQLVEQGKLALDADVNTYLKSFKIPETFPGRPVTLFSLLTHTAGFEDRVYRMFTPRDEKLPALAEHLANEMPTRVRPPGEVALYSNYGFALAGYLVELASGQSYADYVREHIFEPSGMKDSSVAQPTPDVPLATGYRWNGSAQVVPPSNFGPEPPAGDGNVATPADMGRYLSANLVPGTFSRSLLDRLHGARFRNDPRLPAMGFGFSERYLNGLRLVEKTGDSPGFLSVLELIPEKNTGVYLAFNGGAFSGDAAAVTAEVLKAFVDRLQPAAPVPAPVPLAGDVSRFEGSYNNTRLDYDSFTKVRALAGGVTVTADGDGALTTSGLGEGTRRWTQTEPGLFTDVAGERIAFRESGGQVLLFAGDDPNSSYERMSWLESSSTHLLILGVALLLLLGALVFWPIRAFVRRGRERNPSGARFATVAAWSAALAVLLFAGGFALLMSDLSAAAVALTSGHSPLLSVTLLLPDVVLLLTGAAVVCTALAWLRGWWNTPARITYTVVSVALTAFLGVVASYHLVGLPYLA